MTRDEHGRFAKGVSGNPGGRPKEEAAALLRQAVREKLTPTRIAKIAEQLVALSEAGNFKAVEILCAIIGLDLKQVTIKGDTDQPLTIKVIYERAGHPTA